MGTLGLNPTSSSYVTIYPADASPRPTASNLNFVEGAPPTPNQVTTGLSATGAIGVYNLSGTVDLLVDIVGYYQASSGGGGTQGPSGPQGPKGDQGIQGIQGIQGVKGDTGPSGIVQLGVFTPTQIVQGAVVTCSTATGKTCDGPKVNGRDIEAASAPANVICGALRPSRVRRCRRSVPPRSTSWKASSAGRTLLTDRHLAPLA